MNNITTAWRSLPLGFMLLSALLWSACQKTPLPPDVTEPTVFSVKSLDSSIALTAGLKEVYLYTDFAKDTSGVLVFSGTFAQVGCQPAGACSGSVRFEFRNVIKGSETLPGEAFHEGEFEYADKSSGQIGTIYRATFSAVDTAGFKDFNWAFDSAGTASGKVVQRDFPSPKPAQVTLTSTAFSQMSAVVRRTVSLSGLEQFPEVQVRIQPDTAFNENLIQALAQGAAPLSYKWSPDSTGVNQFFESKLKAQYAVTVTAAGGATASAQANETADLTKPFITPSFVYSVDSITTGDPLQLGRVAIQWIDQQGVVWRSDQGKQGADALFIVNSTAPYDPNEKGQNTRKMGVLFRCFLYTQSGEMREFAGTGVIAVAY